jgi:hypothetical protein
MRRIFLLMLCLAIPSQACLWDSDTLATEAKGLPGVLEVITGRFERNPPLYYEMRLARVTKELQAQPSKLELYDDAAVACDRLHRDAEAIAWMAKKRAHLKPYPQDKDHWYRYHANIGTFQAHLWLRGGADRKKIGEMKTARDNLKRAIQINPNAHFGREKYQLMAIEWIINPPKDFSTFLDYHNVSDSTKAAAAIRGLSGLIVLGDAWESIDVFHALTFALGAHKDGTLVYLAALRSRELIKAGKKSLYPFAPTGEAHYEIIKEAGKWMIDDDYAKVLEKTYHERRQEAESFQQRRTAFMTERLKAGRHPDTDKSFWQGWEDTAPPLPSGDVTFNHWLARTPWAQITLVVLIVLVAPLLVIYVLWRTWKKYKTRITA